MQTGSLKERVAGWDVQVGFEVSSYHDNSVKKIAFTGNSSITGFQV